ncbi:MAG: hypothetical protein EXR93_09650 [Gemmatimonadetes bacterium]|nr:hypothetical protein [Gemmatimonadota bacterium]
MKRQTAVLLFLLVVLVAGACIFPRRAADPGDLPSDPWEGPITVSVENQNFYDATIYAVSGTSRERLGNVRGLGADRFSFTWKATEVYFIIALLAVGEYPTEQISINPGDQLELTIDPALHHKSRR